MAQRPLPFRLCSLITNSFFTTVKRGWILFSRIKLTLALFFSRTCTPFEVGFGAKFNAIQIKTEKSKNKDFHSKEMAEEKDPNHFRCIFKLKQLSNMKHHQRFLSNLPSFFPRSGEKIQSTSKYKSLMTTHFFPLRFFLSLDFFVHLTKCSAFDNGIRNQWNFFSCHYWLWTKSNHTRAGHTKSYDF